MKSLWYIYDLLSIGNSETSPITIVPPVFIIGSGIEPQLIAISRIEYFKETCDGFIRLTDEILSSGFLLLSILSDRRTPRDLTARYDDSPGFELCSLTCDLRIELFFLDLIGYIDGFFLHVIGSGYPSCRTRDSIIDILDLFLGSHEITFCYRYVCSLLSEKCDDLWSIRR